jgi:hypothetical protein
MLVLLSAAPEPAETGPNTIDVSRFPEKYQQLYGVVSMRCSKCHTLSRVTSARLDAEGWRLYVKKMARRPGAGISPAVAQQLTDFLSFYSAQAAGAASGAGASDAGAP